MVRPLSTAFNRAVIEQASIYCPRGYDVRQDAPSTLEEVTRYYLQHGRLCVWSGASDSSIFGDASVNHAFRAWHDWHHIAGAFAFDAIGERATMHAQIRDVAAYGQAAPLFAALVECEVMGQFHYAAKHGGFPSDQMAFARYWLSERQITID